jgi:hypothetical protein
MNPKLALAFVCVCAPCWAQTAPAAAQATPVAPASVPVGGVQPPVSEPSEPNVKHTVIEDKGSKIDELRVRGQLTHVIVTPKVGITKSYELIMSRSGREPPDGTGGVNTGVGKRVWNVVNF